MVLHSFLFTTLGTVSQILQSPLRCHHGSLQEFKEKVSLDLHYSPNINKNLKLIFFEEHTKLGEAVINLAFYIDNNLPAIIDKIPIQSKYDSQAFADISFAWSRADSSLNSHRHQSPLRESPIKPRPLDPADKKTVHSSYTEWKEHQDQLKIKHDKKLAERPRLPPPQAQENPAHAIPWEDSLRKAEVRHVSPRRFQTPNNYKPEKCLNNFKSAEEHKSDHETMEQIKSNLKQLEKKLEIIERRSSPAVKRYDSKIKARAAHLDASKPEIEASITRQKLSNKRLDDCFQTDQRDTYLEKKTTNQHPQSQKLQEPLELKHTKTSNNKTLQTENSQLQQQLQKVQVDYQQTLEKLQRSELEVQFLSENYEKLRTQFQRQQSKSYLNNNSNKSLKLKETEIKYVNDSHGNQTPKSGYADFKQFETGRKSIEAKQAELQQKQAELEFVKTDLEISRREIDKFKREIENYKGEIENSRKTVDKYKRELEAQVKQIEALQRDLAQAQFERYLNEQSQQQQQLQEIKSSKSNQPQQGGNVTAGGSGPSNSQDIIEGQKKVIKEKQRQLDEQEKELNRLMNQIRELESKQGDGQRELRNRLSELEQASREQEGELLKLRQMNENQEHQLRLKNQEIQLLTEQNKVLTLNTQNGEQLDIQKIINDFNVQIANLKQENSELQKQRQMDLVRIDGITKELEINKAIADLREETTKELEQELFLYTEKLRQEKQNMADMINVVMEQGGSKYLEEIEKSMAYRQLTMS